MRGIPNWRGSSGNWLALILGFALLMGAFATFMFSSPAIQTVTFYSTSVLSYSGCNTNLTGCIIGITSYATSTSTTTLPAQLPAPIANPYMWIILLVAGILFLGFGVLSKNH